MSEIIVQKFGGTSVGSDERINAVANIIKKATKENGLWKRNQPCGNPVCASIKVLKERPPARRTAVKPEITTGIS